MISIENLSVAYGGFVLLDNIGFHISDNDKIGLVGKNGAGKSTILKMIAGLQNPTSGRIDKPKGITVGYLPQLMEHHRGKTVLEETMTAFESTSALEKEIEQLTNELAQRTDYESISYNNLINKLSDLNDQLSISDSEPPEVQARRTLCGLGFKDDELSRLTETFSQGWNMRIELAKILLKKPKVLLLDEPTNHLDIESIEWLESYLKNNKCSLLLVSHDRRFLDNLTNRTIEVVLGKIQDYKVPYSKYLELRAERIQQQTAAYENQQKMIQKTEEFIQAFRYKPTKSNQVQSRIKALEKLERVEIDETDNIKLHVKFPPASRTGDVVYRATNMTVGYPEDGCMMWPEYPGSKVIFSSADIEIKRGEKVALVGRNGEGKTTLMRVISGALEPLSGESKVGHNVNLGYFAQNQEDILDKDDTVFSTVDRIATGEMRTRLRDLLAQFLFRGEDIDKRVSVLSGGERARLGMAKLMLQNHNVLALDEPTNHMDIKSKDILKSALKEFDGTLILVSHDRDFLSGLVEKIYEFRGGKVYEHLSGIEEFLNKRKIENLQELERKFNQKQITGKSPTLNTDLSKVKNKENRRIKAEIESLEKEISSYEEMLKTIEAKLASPTLEDDILALTGDYLKCKDSLDSLTAEWLEKMEKMG